MTNKQAVKIYEAGLHPVLLGREGDALKRPLQKGWQAAEHTAAEVAAWPAGNNVGVRCGRQRDGRALAVFDFDAEADCVFPAWQRSVARCLSQRPVVVASGRGYHAYVLTAKEQRSRTLAGRVEEEGGRRRLIKFVELLGRGRQVVAAGCRHPGGRRYRFRDGAGYGDIPLLDDGAFRRLVALARAFDERPPRPPAPESFRGVLPPGVGNCLTYARRLIGGEEQIEPNGDIRFLGHGGLVVTADGRGWYAFADDVGGGLPELVAWHRALVGEG